MDTIKNVPAKVCPECGISLEGVDYHAHSLSHWPDYLDPAKSSKEARKRKGLLDAGGITPSEYAKLREAE